MIPAKELKAWVDRLIEHSGDDACVAVDDGGLTLVVAGEEGRDAGFIIVGGVPQVDDGDESGEEEQDGRQT